MPRHWEEGYKGPLPGNYLEFLTPFLRKGFANPSATKESRVICFCKEAVGRALGMPLSPPRFGTFGDNTGTNPAQTNANFNFSKRANKGANQYKLLLAPGTTIEATFFNPETQNPQTKNFVRNSVSLSFDSSVSVTEMKLWLISVLPSDAELKNNIYGLVTPSLKTHSWRSKSDTSFVTEVTAEMTQLIADLDIKYV